jgi:predicted double-glycine peptidase
MNSFQTMNFPATNFGQQSRGLSFCNLVDFCEPTIANPGYESSQALLGPTQDAWSGQSFESLFQPMDLCRMLQSWLQSFSQFQEPGQSMMPMFPSNPNQASGEFPTYGPSFPKAAPVAAPTAPAKSSAPVPKGSYIKTKLLRQGNGSSCGQTSVAMAVNTLAGKNWTDSTVNQNFGYDLLGALNSGTAKQGLVWRDRDFSKKSWPLIEDRLKRGRPVVMGLNGPMFSPSGRGHIITLLGTKGDKIIFADPATGERRTCKKSDIENAPNHPDGKFFFYASKER